MAIKNNGYADLFTSRRTCYEQCYYWNYEKNKDVVDREELCRKVEPTGMFSAKEYNEESENYNVINNAFMFDRTSISLKTYDDISEMENKDIVKYDNRIWSVVSIRKKKLRRQGQFGVDTPYIYIIELRS